jgi:hypothetical protein
MPAEFRSTVAGAELVPIVVLVRINVNRGPCISVQQIARAETQIFIEN